MTFSQHHLEWLSKEMYTNGGGGGGGGGGGRGNGRGSESRNVPQAAHSEKSEKKYGLITKEDRYTQQHTFSYVIHIIIQWKLSITDALRTIGSVLIKQVSLFQRSFSTLLNVHVAGTLGGVLIGKVSLFRRSLIERFHCMVHRYNIHVAGLLMLTG